MEDTYLCPHCNKEIALAQIEEHNTKCKQLLANRLQMAFDEVNGGSSSGAAGIVDEEVWQLLSPPETYSGCSSVLSEVIPGFLFLGSSVIANDDVILRANNIRYVLCVAGDVKSDEEMYSQLDIHFRRIPMDDSTNFSIRQHFEEAFAFINYAKQQQQRVLVHCSAGVSRSATTVIAYLMRHGSSDAKHPFMTLRQALSLVRQARPYVYPNKRFFKALIDYEAELFGGLSQPSITLEALRLLHEDRETVV